MFTMRANLKSRRVAALLVLVAAFAALLVPAQTSPADAASAYQWDCYAVRSEGESQSHGECYKLIERISRDFKVGYRDSLVNNTSRTATLECEASESQEFNYGASITIGASIKAGIFASIDASTTVTMNKTLSSGYAVKAGVSVPPHSTVYCDRVVYRERFKVEKCLNYYGTMGSCRYLTFWAPSVRGWRLHEA